MQVISWQTGGNVVDGFWYELRWQVATAWYREYHGHDFATRRLAECAAFDLAVEICMSWENTP